MFWLSERNHFEHVCESDFTSKPRRGEMVHTEESQLCMENSEGRSQQNVVERDTPLESKEDDDTNQENIFFIGDD